MATFEAGTLVSFDPGQLAAGGEQTPAVTISGLSGPTAIAFDASGSLWVANSPKDAVFKYSPAQLDTTGSPQPEVLLSASEGSIASPFALAFDDSGKLWVANIGTASIVAFTPQMLAVTGSPAPEITIASSGAGSFVIPVGLAFDTEGSLWVAGGDNTLYKFAQSKLGETGKPVPSAELLLDGHSLLSGVAFWPKPARLPIN